MKYNKVLRVFGAMFIVAIFVISTLTAVYQTYALSTQAAINSALDNTNGRLRLKIEAYDSTANTKYYSWESIANQIYDSGTAALTVSFATTGTPQFARIGLGAAADTISEIKLTNGAKIDNTTSTLKLNAADVAFNSSKGDYDFYVNTYNQTAAFKLDAGDDAIKFNAFTDYTYAATSAQSYSITSTSRAAVVLSNYSATGASTIHLMSNLIKTGRQLLLIDSGGNSDPNSIVIDTEGSETINGGNTYTIATDYKQTRLFCDGTNWFAY